MHPKACALSRHALTRVSLGPLAVIAASLFAIASIAQTAKPVIVKIDPPNWFTRMPDSLLLVHGEHLENTAFTLGGGARIKEATTSPSGHWAFLTIETAAAQPGPVELNATNSHGSTTAPFILAARRSVAEQPKGFNSADVMYLIMPDRFADGDLANDKVAGFRDPDDRSLSRSYHGGDLRGITGHLDYLQQLGVTTIWTTPLYDNSASQSGQTYHGYSATDMYRVDPHFGDMADYRALVTAAHARNMKIVLDTVPNHVGPNHPWVKDPPTPDWFHGTAASHIRVDDDFLSVVDPTASAARRDVLLNGWFADTLPDLNQDNPLVAQYLLQNAVWWVETAGLDGLRIDTFPYVPRSFWHGYNQQLRAFYPHMTAVGEIFNKDPHITSFFTGGRVNTGSDGSYDTLLDTPFDFPLYFALRASLTHHAPMTVVADVLKADGLYAHPENLVTFIGNHDTKRFLSEPGANPNALHLAFGLLATLRGMPQLYYGDEIGMSGGDDPDNRKDFPGGFPKDKANAFAPSGRNEDQQKMNAWVESMMQLRMRTPALQSGQQRALLADKDSLAFSRSIDGTGNCVTEPKSERYLIVVNNDPAPRDITLILDSNPLAGCTHFESVLPNQATADDAGGKLRVHLAGQEIGVFRARLK